MYPFGECLSHDAKGTKDVNNSNDQIVLSEKVKEKKSDVRLEDRKAVPLILPVSVFVGVDNIGAEENLVND